MSFFYQFQIIHGVLVVLERTVLMIRRQNKCSRACRGIHHMSKCIFFCGHVAFFVSSYINFSACYHLRYNTCLHFCVWGYLHPQFIYYSIYFINRVENRVVKKKVIFLFFPLYLLNKWCKIGNVKNSSKKKECGWKCS